MLNQLIDYATNKKQTTKTEFSTCRATANGSSEFQTPKLKQQVCLMGLDSSVTVTEIEFVDKPSKCLYH